MSSAAPDLLLQTDSCTWPRDTAECRKRPESGWENEFLSGVMLQLGAMHMCLPGVCSTDYSWTGSLSSQALISSPWQKYPYKAKHTRPVRGSSAAKLTALDPCFPLASVKLWLWWQIYLGCPWFGFMTPFLTPNRWLFFPWSPPSQFLLKICLMKAVGC